MGYRIFRASYVREASGVTVEHIPGRRPRLRRAFHEFTASAPPARNGIRFAQHQRPPTRLYQKSVSRGF